MQKTVTAWIQEEEVDYLIFPVNWEGVHWALYAIDFDAHTVFYGNSLCWRQDKKDQQLILAWLENITGCCQALKVGITRSDKGKKGKKGGASIFT